MNEYINIPIKVYPESLDIPTLVFSEYLDGENSRIVQINALDIAKSYGSFESFNLETKKYTLRYFLLDGKGYPIQVRVKSHSVVLTDIDKDTTVNFVNSINGYAYEPSLEHSLSWIFDLMTRMLIFSHFKRNHVNKYYLDLFKKPTEGEIKFISGFTFFHNLFDAMNSDLIDQGESGFIKALFDTRNWGPEPPFTNLNQCIIKQLAFYFIVDNPFIKSILARIKSKDSFARSLEKNLYLAYGRAIGKPFVEPVWRGKPTSCLSCQKIDFSIGGFRDNLFTQNDTIRIIFSDKRVVCISKKLIEDLLENSVRTKRQVFIPVHIKTRQLLLDSGFYYNIFIGTPFSFLITQDSYLSVFRQGANKNLYAKVSGYFDFIELIDAVNGEPNPKIHTDFFYDILA